MSIEKTLLDNHERYMKSIEDFNSQQLTKLENIIGESQKGLQDIKSFEKANVVDKQTAALMQRVNQELDKAVANINQQMNELTQQP